MIKIELTEGWDGRTVCTSETANDERICDFIRHMAIDKCRVNPSAYWSWNDVQDGVTVVDFGSHTWFARVKGYDPTAKVASTKDVLEDYAGSV